MVFAKPERFLFSHHNDRFYRLEEKRFMEINQLLVALFDD